jgi:Ser/Thr protein kinase RdoA (MazF antagonist)
LRTGGAHDDGERIGSAKAEARGDGAAHVPTACFDIPGRLLALQGIGGGLIHESYVATYEVSGQRRRYVHQRINTEVFRSPDALMDNIVRVTAHLRSKLAQGGCTDLDRRALSLVLARNAKRYCRDEAGGYWRTYRYIEGTRTCQSVDSRQRAFEAARAFGGFVDALADLPGPRLAETIPHFHDTPRRFQALADAVQRDPVGRAEGAKAELEFAWGRRSLGDLSAALHASGGLTERVVHNDTKVSNVLFDSATGEALCVVDLDTVMPGLVLHDFGDLVRSSVAAGSDSSTGSGAPTVRLRVFEALVAGYLAGTEDRLSEQETALLARAGQVVALELGIRFLKDYLEGDRYFKVERPGQNLDRCRRQFALLLDLERNEGAMARAVERARAERR